MYDYNNELDMIYFLFFILGILCYKLIRTLLGIYDSYRIFKYSETYTILLLLETEGWRKQCLTILKLAYEDVGRGEEYTKIDAVINKRFDEVHNGLIGLIKRRLPYETKYNSLKESEPYIKEELLKLKGEQDDG
jgi:hypothetical protein